MLNSIANSGTKYHKFIGIHAKSLYVSIGTCFLHKYFELNCWPFFYSMNPSVFFNTGNRHIIIKEPIHLFAPNHEWVGMNFTKRLSIVSNKPCNDLNRYNVILCESMMMLVFLQIL